MIYINKFDNSVIFKHQSISLFWYLDSFLEKDKTVLPLQVNISVYSADQFAPFSFEPLIIMSKW